jgi:hypothetical protein
VPPLPPRRLLYVPKRLSWNGDPKPQRPHVTVTEVGGALPGHLIFGSSSDLEAEEGAWWDTAAHGAATGTDNGLHAPLTYFYPGVLVQVPAGVTIADESWTFAAAPYDRLVAGLRFALGIGDGTAMSTTKLDHWRGRIVPLKRTTAAAVRTPVALALTEARYSRARCYQLLLPLLDGTGLDPRHDPPHTVRLSAPAWAPLVGPNVSTVLMVPALLLGLRHERHVEDSALNLRAIATAAEMRAVEASLTEWFKLPGTSAKRRYTPSEVRDQENQRRLKQFERLLGRRR